MNENNQVKIVCPRCGSQIAINARCCLQCGWLNPNDPANQQINKIIEKNKEETYQVGSLQNIAYKDGQVTNSIASKTGSRKVCFLINYLMYIFIILLSFMIVLSKDVLSFNVIKNSIFPYIVFVTSILFLYVYSMELIFIKANKRWWYSLVPFYNLFILSEIVFKKKWLGIILLIPVVGQLFFIVTLYKLATKFKYSGLLTILFPIIYIPLMGFGSRLYEDVHYADDDLTLENDYRRKKVFFISLLLFLLISSGFIFWNNIIEIKSKAFKLKNYYYIIATNQIVKKTKQLAKENYLECNDYSYHKDKGIYYVEYADIGSVAYIPFHTYADVINGYVVIDNRDGTSKYYISISDGTYGYPETSYEDVGIDSIVPYEEIVKRSDINMCLNTKARATVGGMK